MGVCIGDSTISIPQPFEILHSLLVQNDNNNNDDNNNDDNTGDGEDA
jgi:hypothetical protein